jgi:hypothetical protein
MICLLLSCLVTLAGEALLFATFAITSATSSFEETLSLCLLNIIF